MTNLGKEIVCDRCGERIFLKRIDVKELDGGFTRSEQHEKKPDGWGSQYVGEKIVDLCPDCYSYFNELCRDFMKYTVEVEG